MKTERATSGLFPSYHTLWAENGPQLAETLQPVYINHSGYFYEQSKDPKKGQEYDQLRH